ncbi:hypothetical protein [Flavobacterium sp. HBTb2-11-1]|uniref:hypothetical protein n=1 Tax=Flavobacterium sp. HBTb2-11-1 TaxID=2692212 RepID=UPI00136B4670|nr:hypothetical protein [Flavobacterium sp. HBTb2-11-1]MXO03319.1 hypothetical protein [Flavobacterium sp. HBTb2-11-1]
MILENIIEICVAIDIAILGIAYPIIVDKISNIGDKYSSEYLSVLFNNDFPQKTFSRSIKGRDFEISIFKLTLFLTILTFFFLIFNEQPPFGFDNWFVNNSAKIIVLIFTTFLTIFFFMWLDKVVLYNGKSTSLLKYIILKYNSTKDNDEIKPYYLKAINELTFYAVEKQDEHLQKTLLEFYYQVFKNIRKNHDKSKPLIYPVDLYFLVNRLNSELISSHNKKLQAIEHRAVSAVWLLGEDFEDITISEDTYNWIWQNLYIICDNDKFIKMYWANVNQYFDFRLKYITPEYDKNHTLINDEAIKAKEIERNNFLEFHFALGGLLLYRNQYETIKYIFQFTQSQPPKYVLLPESMTMIFNWFENFRNEFKSRKTPIDIKYYFPELDNLGTRRQVNYWICYYLTLLFVRQYSLNKYYTFHDFISQPNLPEDVLELNNWLDSVSFFKECLKDVLSNKELLQKLNFEKIVTDNKDQIEKFADELKKSIETKIGQKKLYAPLSKDKIKDFELATNKILSKAFEDYKSIFNKENIPESNDNLKLYIKGEITLMSKSAFTDDDITYFDYDSIFANYIAENNINKYIPNSFLTARTKRYLLNIENILIGIEKIIGKNKNAILIGVNLSFEMGTIISKSKYFSILTKISSSDFRIQDVFYILNKKDLPFIEYKESKEKEINDLQLQKINSEYNIYTSVIDINTTENMAIKDNWKFDNKEGNLDLKVQIAIAFLAIIHWRKERDIIQISIASQFKEQGIQTDINELDILRNEDDRK